MILLVLSAAILSGCSRTPAPPPAGQLKVVAPDFLRGILDRAAQQFQDENGVVVTIQFANPGQVIEQAKAGSATDLFFLGSPKRFEYFKNDTALSSRAYSCPFRLSMVLVGRIDGPRGEKLEHLTRDEFRRVVIVDPAVDYEGQLTARILNRHRLWDKLVKKLILAQSKNHLLTFLETEEADAAIMLESSTAGGRGLTVLKRLDKDIDDRLIICGSVMPRSKNKKVAQAFLDLLDSSLCLIYKISGVHQYDGRR